MPNLVTYGTDTSGRPILMTPYMRDWWTGVEEELRDLGITVTITQGAWMANVPGGGAENSEGFHDGGGPLDLRTWNLTPAEQRVLIRTIRTRGAAIWRRYKRQGFSEDHAHLVLGTDTGLTPDCARQWADYLNGRDGLASRGPDYEWRPSPLITTPPEDDMPLNDNDIVKIRAVVREAVAAELDTPVETKRGKRSLRQMVKELFQR